MPVLQPRTEALRLHDSDPSIPEVILWSTHQSFLHISLSRLSPPNLEV